MFKQVAQKINMIGGKYEIAEGIKNLLKIPIAPIGLQSLQWSL